MKKLLVLLSFGSLLLPQAADAQQRRAAAPVRQTSYGGSAFGKGVTFLDVGVGLGSYRYRSAVPLGITIDHGIAPQFSLGLQADFYRFKRYSGRYGYTYTHIPIALRGAYHFTNLGNSRADLYLGAALGYVWSRYTTDAPNGWKYVDDDASEPYAGVFLGGRYLLSPQVGLMAELGYGVSVGKVGVTFRF